MPTLFTLYLRRLGVPCTATWSDRAYKAYPPRLALSAFSDLLHEYHVDTTPVDGEPSPDTLAGLRTPFVARLSDGSMRIVTDVAGGKVDFIAPGDRPGSLPASVFAKAWSGKGLEAATTPQSSEPDYRRHRTDHIAAVAERAALRAVVALLAIYFFVSNGLWSSWSLIALTLLYSLGLYVGWLLLLKQSNVESAAADSVCNVIQQHGCNKVVNSESASFLGLFHWSEIGFTFFAVSLGALLLYPPVVNYLAYISVACLPYTVWSVLTQRFRLHNWCTLCLCVQALFWIIFGVCLGGGHLHGLFPLKWDVAVLLAAYLGTLLAVHKWVPVYFAYERAALTGASAD